MVGSLWRVGQTAIDDCEGTLPTLPVKSRTRLDVLSFLRLAVCNWVRAMTSFLLSILTFDPLERPLASGFDILAGRQEITVPADTEPGTDYAIVCESRILISGILWPERCINQCLATLETAVKPLPLLQRRVPASTDGEYTTTERENILLRHDNCPEGKV